MRRHDFSQAAQADFEGVMQRIEADDPATAQAVAQRLRASVETVCLFPGTGQRTDVPGVWIFGGTKHQPFRFTYQVFDDRILVLRIFRHSRGEVLT